MSATLAEHGVVVVGAGQAGVSLSYYLQEHAIDHVLLERATPFSAWKSRWDGFHANTPNWMNTLPRSGPPTVPGGDPSGFATREELVEYLEDYAREVSPPLISPCEVSEAYQQDDGSWRLTTDRGSFSCRNVAVCTGAMSTSLIPELGNRLDRSVPQLHSLDYRCPEDIKTSRVLIVGSGSSGVQICTEFCKSNRFEELHLATSNVLVLPEHVLGIQVHRFLHFFGLFDARVRSPLGKLMYGRIELKGDPIRPPTPKDLARDGRVILHERLTESEGRTLGFKDGSSISTENLTILWCTGYKGAYGWIHAKAGSVEFDERGYPKHERGVIEGCPGLYFVGLRYQYTVASHDIYGVGRDAKYVAERIAASLARSLPTRVPLPNVSSTRKAA